MDNQNKLVIGENSWEGFQGMFVYYNECGLIGFYYKINGLYYCASSLEQEDVDDNSYHSGCDLMDSFTIDRNSSEILVINIAGQGLLYQQLSNGIFVEILPTTEEDKIIGNLDEPPYKLKIPLPNGQDINGEFQELILNKVGDEIIKKFEDYMYDEETGEDTEIIETEVVNILNSLYENK
jgi:hypothetical protein